jgi:hypothetical protein
VVRVTRGYPADVAVYLAWMSLPPEQPAVDLVGPWEEAREVAAGLLLLESTESLSTVYHAVKWSLPPEAALVVTPVEHTPKSRGLANGTTAWLRARTSAP